jgi:hypothetical protein
MARGTHALSIPKIGIAYQAFNALDEVVFAGKFKDAVFLEFKGVCANVSGATYIPGYHPNLRVTRIAIVLNSDNHGEAILDQIFASLLHHMIHAYFLIACGPQHCDEPKGGKRLRYGNHFG